MESSVAPQSSCVFATLSDAYQSLLRRALLQPDHVLPAVTPDQVAASPAAVTRSPHWFMNRAACQELVNVHFTLTAPREEEVLVTQSPARDAVMADYARRETILFDAGDTVGLKALSAVWRKIANPDGTVNANYGTMVYHLRDAGHAQFEPDRPLRSQWEWARDALVLTASSNQSYLHFNRPKDQWSGNLDQPCCMYVQFLIREQRLHLYVNMRSNDLVYGFPYNMLYFIKLLHRMQRDLLPVYPTLQVGDLHYHATSLHIYEKHLAKGREMTGLQKE